MVVAVVVLRTCSGSGAAGSEDMQLVVTGDAGDGVNGLLSGKIQALSTCCIYAREILLVTIIISIL